MQGCWRVAAGGAVGAAAVGAVAIGVELLQLQATANERVRQAEAREEVADRRARQAEEREGMANERIRQAEEREEIANERARRAERALEQVRARRAQRWLELNREYPIPEFLRPYVTDMSEGSWEGPQGEHFVNVGVLGNSGTGKSSLIRAMLEHFHPTEAGSEAPAVCFEGDGTEVPTPYSLEALRARAHIWDLPGQGTAKFPQKTYLRDMGLKYFDAVLLVTAGRWLENDGRLLQAVRFAGIWVNVVRTKMDQAVEAGEVEGGLSQEQVFEDARETLARQLDEPDPTKIHLVTARRRCWPGGHGSAGCAGFGGIDRLCEQVAERVRSPRTLAG